MLFVGCLTNLAEAEKFISKTNAPSDCVVLRATENDVAVGYIALKVAEDTVRVFSAEYGDGEICEMLLRAAVNYGERRGAEKAVAKFEIPESVSAALGFRLIDGELTTSVNNVVHMCKNCHN